MKKTLFLNFSAMLLIPFLTHANVLSNLNKTNCLGYDNQSLTYEFYPNGTLITENEGATLLNLIQPLPKNGSSAYIYTEVDINGNIKADSYKVTFSSSADTATVSKAGSVVATLLCN